MSARRASLLVLAKMALSDGQIAPEERDFLAPMLDEGESMDALLEAARGRSVAELVGGVDRYADRFFIALRAASMASIDSHLDAREEALYETLVAQLEITEDDQALIQRSVAALMEIEEQAPDPRIEALYAQSSFA